MKKFGIIIIIVGVLFIGTGIYIGVKEGDIPTFKFHKLNQGTEHMEIMDTQFTDM